MGHRRAGPRLVVADRRRRHGVPDVGDQRQAVQAAVAGHLRQRLHRRDARAGPVERRDQRAGARARQRDAGRVRTRSATWSTRSTRAPASSSGSARPTRACRSAAGIARTRTRRRRRSPTASGSTCRSALNIGLFCYTLDGTLLWKRTWPPQPIYLDFGTGSSPVVHDGRVYLLQDSEKRVLPDRARREDRRRRLARRRAPDAAPSRARRRGPRRSSGQNSHAHRDRHDRPRLHHELRPRRQGTLAA